MPGKRSSSDNPLLEKILKDTVIAKAGLNDQYLQSILKPFLQVLEDRYPADWQSQQKVWENYLKWLSEILEWLEQNAAEVLSWRSHELCWREGFKLLADLFTLNSFAPPPQNVSRENNLYPLLEERRANLQRWTAELWEQESVITYALSQSLPAQFFGAGLEYSDIASAFAEKIDDILLTYDPTLAGHASLKTYATYLVYRHLLDKLRRTGYTNSTTNSAVAITDLEQVADKFDLTETPLVDQIKEKGLQVCLVTLTAGSAFDKKGYVLSKIRLQLFYFNLLSMAVNSKNSQNILLSEAAQIFLNLTHSKLAPPAQEILQLASHKQFTTLQNLSDALSLDNTTLANRVQLSQARRLVAVQAQLISAVKEFVETAPYKPSLREPLTQKPLKIVDFCFSNFEYFGYTNLDG